MYFVHPQIQLRNALKAGFSLLKPSQEKKLKEKLGLYFPGKQLIFTDMAREAFKVIIEKANLSGTSMMLPAYICDIFYPILKNYKITPIFLDVDLKTFHIKISDIKSKIAPDTKSILVCHTYGLPIDIKAVREAVGPDILIIEDCAHNFLAGNAGDDGEPEDHQGEGLRRSELQRHLGHRWPEQHEQRHPDRTGDERPDGRN